MNNLILNIFLNKLEKKNNYKKKIKNLVKYIFLNNKNNHNICIILVNKRKIKKLNKLYKKNNSYTNVLTFTNNSLIIKNVIFVYSDIFICKEILEFESKIYKIKFYSHLIHMIVHSCLHIIGYDHIKYCDFLLMKNEEVKILKKFNIKNPYNKFIY